MTKIPIGIHYDIPLDVYLNAAGLSHSMLKDLHPTPAHARAKWALPPEPTPEQLLGTMVHHVILEPDRPMPQLAIKPEGMTFSSNEGKAWRDARLGEHKVIIKADEYKSLIGIANSVAAHPRCREIFEEGESEVCLFEQLRGRENSPSSAVMPITGKMRLDFLPPGNAFVDIKTCTDASPRAFSKIIDDNRYHSQGAWYLDVWNKDPQFVSNGSDSERPRKDVFIIIACEKKPPYLVACYVLEPEAIIRGRELNMMDLATYEYCKANNIWPGYPEEFTPIGLPEWRKR